MFAFSLLALAPTARAQQSDGFWSAVPCDANGGPPPAGTYTSSDGYFSLYGTETWTTTSTYFPGMTSIPQTSSVFGGFGDGANTGDYPSAARAENSDNLNPLHWWYNTGDPYSSTAGQSGYINGTITVNMQGDLHAYYKLEWRSPSSSAPTSPPPDHIDLLLRTNVSAYVELDYFSSTLQSGLSGSAMATDGSPFGETASAGAAGDVGSVIGFHLLRVPVNPAGIAQVSLGGNLHWESANTVPYGTLDHPVSGYPNYITGQQTNGETRAQASSGITAGVKLPNSGLLKGTHINKDTPVSNNYEPLPTPAVLYGGSVRFTSDELLLDAADPNPIPGTKYSWYVFGPGGYAQPYGGSTWNVVLKAAPGVVTFACLVQAPNTAPITKILTVEVGIRTDDAILVGWIDASRVTVPSGLIALSNGVDPTVLYDFAPGAGTGLPGSDTDFPFHPLYATSDIAGLARNNDSKAANQIYTAVDRDYILNWLFKYAPNPDPTLELQNLHTPDPTNPITPNPTWDNPNPVPINTTSDFTCYDGYMDYRKYQAYVADKHRFKLLNRFQVKYRVDPNNPTLFNGDPILLQHEALTGLTNDPTGVLSGIESVLQPTLDLLSDIPGFDLYSEFNNTLYNPQDGPANGLIGPGSILSPGGRIRYANRISQCNDGSPNIPAVRAFNTLMAQHVTAPLFWQNIGSKITFTCGLATPVWTTENYPTYYPYANGVYTNAPRLQAASPTAHFYPNPYPFGTDTSYGLLPEFLGGPLDLPGGRNGIATSDASNTSSTPPYTIP